MRMRTHSPEGRQRSQLAGIVHCQRRDLVADAKLGVNGVDGGGIVFSGVLRSQWSTREDTRVINQCVGVDPMTRHTEEITESQ